MNELAQTFKSFKYSNENIAHTYIIIYCSSLNVNSAWLVYAFDFDYKSPFRKRVNNETSLEIRVNS